MSALTVPEENDPTATGGVIVFTPRGAAALDQLATVLTARCSGTPEGIAQVLDQVLHADMGDLTEALTAIAEASEHRVNHRVDHRVPRRPDRPGADPLDATADAAVRRRLARRDALPSAAGGVGHRIAR